MILKIANVAAEHRSAIKSCCRGKAKFWPTQFKVFHTNCKLQMPTKTLSESLIWRVQAAFRNDSPLKYVVHSPFYSLSWENKILAEM